MDAEKRGCTDIICLFVYIAHWAGFLFVTFLGLSYGSPRKLYAPRDFMGEYCGASVNWNNGLNLENFPKLSYTMNVTHATENIAKQLVCSSAAEAELQSVMTTQQFSDYLCACCKMPCSTCYGSLNLVDLSTASTAASTISAKMTDLANTANAASLFSSDGPNGDYYSSMWNDANIFFNTVCLKLCNTPLSVNLNSSYRTYTYSPPPGTSWKEAWDLLSGSSINTDIKNTVLNAFTFKALPSDQCANDPRYCVPFPGVDFVEEEYDYCSFEVSASVVNAVGQAAADTFDQLGANDISEAASSNFGTAMGDIMATLDALIVVGICSMVIGLLFLVVMRFIVGVVVWCSLFFVFVFVTAVGAFLWLRSTQCKGAGLFETGTQATTAVAIAASSSVSGSTSDETLSDNGADYRGVQTITKDGYTCQKWDTFTPHNHTVTAANYPSSGLVNNYCRNPTGAPTIWCFTTDATTRWQTCSPIGVIRPECEEGYVVESETGRKVMEVLGDIFFILAGLWILLVCCLFSRIRLAIAINKAAAMFIYNTPSVVFVPIIQVVTALIWCLVWVVCATFLVSQVPDGYTPTDYYLTWDAAAGTADTAGACTSNAIPGFAYKDEGIPLSANNPCSGNFGNTTGITPHCYRCAPPRFIFDVRLAYQFFSLLWTNAFLIAIGQCIIAGAVSIWFFSERSSLFPGTVKKSAKMVFRFHTGSLALGSFIIAVIQFLKYMAMYLQKQAEAQKNFVMQCIMRCAQYLLWCLEKCMKFMTKNAYIQVAIKGTNFCTSAKAVFFLLLKNFARFGVAASLGAIMHALGFIFIMSCTVVLGYFILQGLHPDVHPVLPMIIYAIISYVVAKLYMNVFGLAIDTMLQCFICVEKEPGDKSFVPGPLQKFINKNVPAESKVSAESKGGDT
jgi:hypothetical protein